MDKQRLRQYLGELVNKPFHWGDNNCMTFVSGALESTGYDPLPEDWQRGFKGEFGALRAYKRGLLEYGYGDIIEAMDDRFYSELTLHPRDGMICARKNNGYVLGHAFGVSLNSGCIFMTEVGPRWFDVEAGDLFWSVE